MQSEDKKVRLARLERFLPHEFIVSHALKHPLAKATFPLGRAPPYPLSLPRVYKLTIRHLRKKQHTLQAHPSPPYSHITFTPWQRDA